MLLTLSYALAFSVLFIAAISDLKTTEVPDIFPVIGVLGGLLLHLAASYTQGIDFETLTSFTVLFNSPMTWFQALGDPLVWSISIGIAFSIYGWALYFLGVWGGADAFAMSVLGFAAPYGLAGPDLAYPVNLFLNIMIVGFLYTLGFAFYKSLKHRKVWRTTYRDIKEQEFRISLEILGAMLISVSGIYTGSFNGFLYFFILVSFIFLYRLLKNIEDGLMRQTVPVSELEGGEVLAREEEKGGVVKGITEEEIEDIEAESVEIREGVRFVPVFPVALLITMLFGGGFNWLILII